MAIFAFDGIMSLLVRGGIFLSIAYVFSAPFFAATKIMNWLTDKSYNAREGVRQRYYNRRYNHVKTFGNPRINNARKFKNNLGGIFDKSNYRNYNNTHDNRHSSKEYRPKIVNNDPKDQYDYIEDIDFGYTRDNNFNTSEFSESERRAYEYFRNNR